MAQAELKATRRVEFVRSERVSKRLADPAVRARLSKKIKDLESKTKPLMDAIRGSERLNEKDFAIRINTKA